MEVTNLLIKDEVCILEKKSSETQINPVVAPSLIVFSMHKMNVLLQKNIEKYRIEKSIFSYIVSAEKNRFLAKSDRDCLGLQIPRSAVSVGRFVSLLVAPLVRLCKYTPKGDFTCIISPAHLYATGAVMYTALLDASMYLYMRVCPSIGQSVCPFVGPSVRPYVSPSHGFFLAEFNWIWHRNHGKLFFNKLRKTI